MRRRLTARTLAVSALIVVVVAVVLGGLAIAIDRQHKAGERARHSQAVIAAANLTAQRVLGVQTLIRGYLIRGNPDLLGDYAQTRAALPRRRSSCSCWSSPTRASAGSPSSIRSDVAGLRRRLRGPRDRAHARGGVTAGRAFASANDGGARATQLTRLVEQLGARERDAVDAARRATPTRPRGARTGSPGVGLRALLPRARGGHRVRRAADRDAASGAWRRPPRGCRAASST